MLDIIKEELRKDEKLLWNGKVEEFETLDLTCKKHYIKRAIIMCAVVLALCVWYIIYSLSNGIPLKPALIIIVLALAVIGSFNFYFDAKKLRRTTYAITDQRIIRCNDTVKYVDYANIKDVQLKTDEDGHVSLLCGKETLKAKPHQWRSFSLLDPYVEPETGVCERFAMYAISDAENVKNILSDFLPL